MSAGQIIKASELNATILFLKHTSFLVDFFSTKHQIYDPNDSRLQRLLSVLTFFSEWKSGVSCDKEFISSKLWFDLQSLILGTISLIQIKLTHFPGSTIKPAIINQDVVENHFCQLRAANGQNENPTYLLTQATQNAVIFGQSTTSTKCNTHGSSSKDCFTDLLRNKLFSTKNNNKRQPTTISLIL